MRLKYKQYMIVHYFDHIIRDKTEVGNIEKIAIYDGEIKLAEHSPGLDSLMSITDDVLVVTSDCMTWVYSFRDKKEVLQTQDTVAINHNVKVNDDTIIITGIACYWAAEDYQFDFEIVINRKTMKVKSYISDGDKIV